MRYDNTPIKIAKIQKQTSPNAGEDVEQQKFSSIAGGNANGTASLGDSLAFSYKVKHHYMKLLGLLQQNTTHWVAQTQQISRQKRHKENHNLIIERMTFQEFIMLLSLGRTNSIASKELKSNIISQRKWKICNHTKRLYYSPRKCKKKNLGFCFESCWVYLSRSHLQNPASNKWKLQLCLSSMPGVFSKRDHPPGHKRSLNPCFKINIM